MKVKILATLLAVSVLFNIAGLIYFIGFNRLHKDYRALKRERNLMAQSLTASRSASAATDIAESGQMIKRTFVSLIDKQEDAYGLMPPRSSSLGQGSGNTLIVYLHGMGSNYLEPFVAPPDLPIAQAIATHYSDVCLLSCSYRRDASWGSDLAMADISQNIREVLQQYPIKRIVLMGTSMGGCTVLLYATVAPPDIKNQIKGIVSVEGAGNLSQLYNDSQNVEVKNALILALGGTPREAKEAYQRKSFIPNVSHLPSDTRIAVISAKLDKIVPPKLQQDIVNALDHDHKTVTLISIDGGHGAPPAPVYLQGLEYVLGDK